MGAVTAARLREVPRSRGDDDHTPVSAGQDDPLEVRHCCGQRDLVDDDNLPHQIEDSICSVPIGLILYRERAS